MTLTAIPLAALGEVKVPDAPPVTSPTLAVSPNRTPTRLAWLKSQGRGYQTRINQMLREAMENRARRRRA